MKKQPSNRNKSSKQAQAKDAISWTATEANVRQRWWWWLITGYIFLVLAVGFIAFGQWTAAILTLVIFIALIVVYGAKPRQREYTLQGTILTIDALQLELTRYDRFIIDNPNIYRSDSIDADASVQLLPKAFFGLPHTILLPPDPDAVASIIVALSKYVGFRQDDPYAKPGWIMRLVTRWFHLK